MYFGESQNKTAFLSDKEDQAGAASPLWDANYSCDLLFHRMSQFPSLISRKQP